jgi:hypothetical protein
MRANNFMIVNLCTGSALLPTFFGVNMDKALIGYIWLLSIMGALFYGHEIALMKRDMALEAANNQLQNCNKIIAGSIYE